MAVIIGDILPYTQAIATSGQTVFMTNWTANTESDVVVYQTPFGDAPDDVTQKLAYPADYSVAFIGAEEEVQVTLVTGAGQGDIITIIRDTPADRLNLYSNTNFTPSMLNTDFGILTLVDQQAQLVNQLIGPRYNYSAVIQNVIDTILPILGANQLWAKNDGDTAIIALDVPSSGIGPAGATFLTYTNESGDLPNSYQILAGSNISLIPGTNTLTINSLSGGGTVVSLSAATGITLTPNPITSTGTIGLTIPVAVTSGGTGLTTIAANQLLYASAIDTINGLATANNGVLVTDVSGVPSISSTLPTAVQSNITQLGDQSQALNMNTHLINNVVDPVSDQDAATKHYVDTTALNGTSVYAATTTGLTVTQAGAGVGATLTNADTQAVFALDGVNPPLGSNVLIKDAGTGMTAANEGIYTVTDVGSVSTNWVLTRATTYDTPEEINRTGLILIQNGTVNVGTAWYNAATIVTVDTTDFVYTEFGNIVYPINLAHGGTNASLTASAGSVTYSTASAMAFSAVGSSGQLFQSAGTSAPGWTTNTYPSTSTKGDIIYASANNVLSALGIASTGNILTIASGVPAWTTATYPSTTTANQILYSSANNTISEIATVNNGVLITNNSGVPSLLANSVTPGYVLTANSGAPPSWQANTGSAINIVKSSSSSTFSTSSATPVQVTNLSVSITTTGRPVLLTLISDGTAGAGNGGIVSSSGSTSILYFYDSSTPISYNYVGAINVTASAYQYIYTVAAGTYTLSVYVKTNGTIAVTNVILSAYELGT